MVHMVPRLLGTMVHRLMEMLVSTQGKITVDEAVNEICREYGDTMNASFVKELKNSLVLVGSRMLNGGYPQSNDVPQDLYKVLMSADEVYCEVPFSYKDSEAGKEVIVKGVMDIVYCDNGKWHIVDYKTNAEGSDLDAKYQKQLAAYVKAFKATTGNEADALTYHVDV